MYTYPFFAAGEVVFKDSVSSGAYLNFSRFYNQVHFLDEKLDTFILKNVQDVRYVVILNDTLERINGRFYKKLTHFDNIPNLYTFYEAERIGIEKKGPYGTYSPVSSTNSNSTMTLEDQFTTYLLVDEIHVYHIWDEWFLYDPNDSKPNKITPRNFYDYFPKQEKALRKFAETNQLNLNSQLGIMKILQYLNEIKN